MFFMSTFKKLGKLFLFDDQFLTYVGSAYAMMNAAGRLSFGLISDTIALKHLFLVTFIAQVMRGESD